MTRQTFSSPDVLAIVRGVTWWALGFLAAANVITFAVYMLALWIKPDQAAAALQMLGSVLETDKGAALIALGFWLGSSLGSKQKTAEPADPPA